MNDVTYAMIEKKNYEISSRIMDYLLNLKGNIPDRRRRVMVINRANVYKKMDDGSGSDELLSKFDWGAVSNDFLICVASLKEDVPRVVELMPLVLSEKSVSKDDFVEWPVFDWVRGDERFKSKFAELFGVQLISSQEGPALSAGEAKKGGSRPRARQRPPKDDH